MKKIVLSLLLVSGLVAMVNGQTKIFTDANAVKRTVSNFHGIEVATGITLILSQGNTEDVAISAANAEHRDRIVTRVENGILKIHYDTKTGAINKKNESKNLKAYVSCVKLDRLVVTTGAEVEIQDKISASELELSANTGGLVKGQVNASSLKVIQNTGSKITLSGAAGSLDAEGSTGSKFAGENFTTGTCSISVNTGAGVTIHVEKEMNAKASTGGYVKYKGTAGIREIKTNTGGSVSRI
jgi:hypothetical protein